MIRAAGKMPPKSPRSFGPWVRSSMESAGSALMIRSCRIITSMNITITAAAMPRESVT